MPLYTKILLIQVLMENLKNYFYILNSYNYITIILQIYIKINLNKRNISCLDTN